MSNKKAKSERRELVSDQLRRAIRDCGVSRYMLARESGVSQAALSLFMNGHRGLSMTALDALGECLNLRVTVGRKPTNSKGEGK